MYKVFKSIMFPFEVMSAWNEYQVLTDKNNLIY